MQTYNFAWIIREFIKWQTWWVINIHCFENKCVNCHVIEHIVIMFFAQVYLCITMDLVTLLATIKTKSCQVKNEPPTWKHKIGRRLP
jgi:hypothetical protein